MTFTKLLSNTRNNRTREARQGEAARSESAWIPLELDENRTVEVDNSFASCNPTNLKAPYNIFFQRNNFANRRDRKPFSRNKRRNEIGRNGRRMKNHDDECAHKEELAKNGEVNLEFIHNHNISEKSYPED